MLKYLPPLIIGACLVFPLSPVQAKNLSAESGEKQNILLELYTSQGCSSCPPADDWLSGLKKDKRLWKSVFPVAFHVDYWNYIGWTDPYSSDTFSNRQRNYAANGSVSSVYTPGFIVNGKEWRSWFRRKDISPLLGKFNDKPGNLRLSLDGDQLKAEFMPNTPQQKSLVLNAAWLSMNIATDVLAGENGGETLHHDFVCRDWQRLETRSSEGTFHWQQSIPKEQLNKADALVVWVSDPQQPNPIQTTGILLRHP